MEAGPGSSHNRSKNNNIIRKLQIAADDTVAFKQQVVFMNPLIGCFSL